MTEQPCSYFTDYPTRTTCSTPTAKTYLTGPRCPLHTPAAIAGHPEAHPDPTLTLYGRPGMDHAFTPAGETAVDARAKASGRRRSTPQDYRAAQAAVHQEGTPR